ncbi:MAG: hypothetical protein NTX82_02940 [Candidatus Parcubacteria bacterium]|nr:hypothetical protein [Candidatus Parcubacteria bacterium]
MKKIIGFLVFAIVLIGSMSVAQAQTENYNYQTPYASVDRFAIGGYQLEEYHYQIIRDRVVPYALAHTDERIELQPFVSTLLYNNDPDFEKQRELALNRGIAVADAIIAISGGRINRNQIWIYPVVMGIQGTPGSYDPYANQKVDVYFARPGQPSPAAQIQTRVEVVVNLPSYCKSTVNQTKPENRGGYNVIIVTVDVKCDPPATPTPGSTVTEYHGDTTPPPPPARHNCNLNGRLWTILMPIIGFGIGYAAGPIDIDLNGGSGGNDGGGDGGDASFYMNRESVGLMGAGLFLPIGIIMDHHFAENPKPGISLNWMFDQSRSSAVREFSASTDIRFNFFFMPARQ